MAPMLTAILVLASGTTPFAQTAPTGFTVESYAAGLPGATTMAWTPDGRLLVGQLGGAVRVIKGGMLLPTPFHTAAVDSPAGTERGLLGLCVDPGFAANGYVYLYFTHPSPAPHNCVRRLKADSANPDVSDGSETPIVDLEDLGPDTMHNGGSVLFGPDGKLYIAVGDNGDSNHAQSLHSRFGKILRYNADGTIPGDNPTAFAGINGTTSGEFMAIWAVGLRNPYRMAFQPGTSRLFINDVGNATWEEINAGGAGLNYGWTGGDTDGARGMPDFTDPVFQYGHAGTTPMGRAITGGVFYPTSMTQFPASQRGRYFFADYSGGWICSIDPAAPGAAEAFLAGGGGIADLQVGPDGAMYSLTFSGNVSRIAYSSPAPGPGPSPGPSPAPGGGGNPPTTVTDSGKKSKNCGATGLEGLPLMLLAAAGRRLRRARRATALPAP